MAGAQYGNQDYWESRYTRDRDTFEWYQRYDGIRHILTPAYLSKNSSTSTTDATEHINSQVVFPKKERCRVLIVGCGNSALGEDMLKDAWVGGITNIDYSTVVIEQMRDKYDENFYSKLKSRLDRERKLKNKKQNDDEKSTTTQIKTADIDLEEMKFECADVTKMLPFADESFDLIICKGCLDSILCSNGSMSSVRSMMGECKRVLDADNGVMVVITYGKPDNRLLYFENKDDEWWSGGIDVHEVPKPRIPMKTVEDRDMPANHYVYVCKR